MTIFLATLPPEAFLRAVMEVRPYTSSFTEAARLVTARLLSQQGSVRERKTLSEETETMPAIIRERRLKWRQP